MGRGPEYSSSDYMASIMTRKAMVKELAAAYHAECLSYCKQLLELQGQWNQELDASNFNFGSIELPQGPERSNLNSVSKRETCMEIACMPAHKSKQVSSTVSASSEDAVSGGSSSLEWLSLNPAPPPD